SARRSYAGYGEARRADCACHRGKQTASARTADRIDRRQTVGADDRGLSADLHSIDHDSVDRDRADSSDRFPDVCVFADRAARAADIRHDPATDDVRADAGVLAHLGIARLITRVR
ncbi:hypothetical protein, partial [Burkholderia multivorans]|uniref:hypothetical protein n=1 Tax=Burkholderia multivorans TaxID=87883 RepID=UPI001C614457